MKVLPYIQQHFFDLEPLRPKASGFAAFVDIVCPKEKLDTFFESPKGCLKLNKTMVRSQGITFAQSDLSRQETAVGGELSERSYTFNISSDDHIIKSIDLDFQSCPLEPPSLQVKKGFKKWQIEWKKKHSFSNFWVFAIPDIQYKDWSSFFNLLKPITKNHFSGNRIELERNPFGFKQNYRILVRANEQKLVEDFPRFSRESWGVSTVLV